MSEGMKRDICSGGVYLCFLPYPVITAVTSITSMQTE